MGLRAKLFSAFFTIILGLLIFTLYYSNSKTLAFESTRITQQLFAIQSRFLDRFDNESSHNLKLVKTITSDQKYRSFLQQVRDNFYSFAEEIASDTSADIVFIVDEEFELRGASPPKQDTISMDQQTRRVLEIIEMPGVESTIEDVLDSGEDYKQVIAFGDNLFNSVFVPLKESLQDDYALGVVNVGIRLTDSWVVRLLADDVDDVDVIFHIDGRPIASDMQGALQKVAVQAALAMSGSSGLIRLNDERHIVVKGEFENAGDQAGYVITASLDKAMAPFISLQWEIFAAGLTALVIGVAIVLLLTNKIVNPIRLLVQGTREVMTGNYDYHVENRSSDEVGQLATAFNHMIAGLKEKEQIRNLFGKYVHPSIVSDIMENPDNLEMGGTRKKQTLLFSDIEGFTTISETMNAEQLVDFLNDYLSAMTEELSGHEGILDKYLGDGIMAFWGPPFTKQNHALQACRAALAMQDRLKRKVVEWAAQGRPEIRMRIGVASGDVIVGNIGSEQSRDYTCIGDTVNLSSRLEGVNKVYGTRIIIDEEVRVLAAEEIIVRELDTVQVKGREGGTRIFELVGLSPDVGAQKRALIEQYEKALQDYRAGNFAKARDGFAAIVESTPDDFPSKEMYQQCTFYIDNPVQNWTAIRVLSSK